MDTQIPAVPVQDEPVELTLVDLVGAATGTVVLTTTTTAAKPNRYFTVTADGTHSWGSGGGTFDCTLSRNGTGEMKLVADSGIRIQVTGAGSDPFKVFLNADAKPTLQINGDGSMQWSPGGATVSDTGVLRNGVGILEQKSGTTAQAFRVYGTTTGSKYTFISNDGSSGYLNTNGAGSSLYLGSSGVSILQIASTGHLLFFADNANDVGGSANRARNIYWGTQTLGPDGSVGTPAYSFASATNHGITKINTNILAICMAGNERFRFNTSAGYLVVPSDYSYTWSSTTDSSGSPDVLLARDAAATLAQKNGANAQTFRVYGTTTGPVYVELLGGASQSTLRTNSGSMQVYTVGASQLQLGANNAIYWRVETAGSLTAQTDNSYDTGALNATRPRSGYFGTSVSVGDNPALAGAYRVAYAAAFNTRNSTNAADYTLIEGVTINSIVNLVRVGLSSAGMQWQIRSGGAPPSTSDLPSGFATVWNDTGGATTKLYANIGGSIKSVALA